MNFAKSLRTPFLQNTYGGSYFRTIGEYVMEKRIIIEKNYKKIEKKIKNALNTHAI